MDSRESLPERDQRHDHRGDAAAGEFGDRFFDARSVGDLGDLRCEHGPGGAELGSLVVSGSVNGTVSQLVLNSAGIAYLKGQSGQFAIGGALTTLTRNPEISERLFNSGNGAGMVRELVVTYEPASEVPEPGTWLLVAAGLAALGRTKRPRAAS